MPLHDTMPQTNLPAAESQRHQGCLEHWMLPFQILTAKKAFYTRSIEYGITTRGEAGLLIDGVFRRFSIALLLHRGVLLVELVDQLQEVGIDA